ncbi:hypothetical protein AB0D57_08030 [Streptomyces sp. NPDC048275]|uniref:hypothetical protein n=1 Tax=Streptomyces sp. NPDC048275 TaxID=3155629 RepID=UPI0033FA5B55
MPPKVKSPSGPAPHPVTAALGQTSKVLKSANVTLGKASAAAPGAPKPARKGVKGRLIPLPLLATRAFAASLADAIAREVPEAWQLGHTKIKDFRAKVIEAARLLKGEKVTVSAWIGQFTELIGVDLKEVRAVIRAVTQLYRAYANEAVRKGGKGFVNGLFEPVKVTKEFHRTLIIRDLRIKTPNQKVGVKYVDHARLFANADDQHLFATVECKTRGAADEIPDQIASRDSRLQEVAHIPGTVITYTIVHPDGRTEPGSMEVSKLLLRPGDKVAARYSKVSIQAGSGFKAYLAKDAHGEEFVRIIVALGTDPIRQALARVLKDRSWQRKTP